MAVQVLICLITGIAAAAWESSYKSQAIYLDLQLNVGVVAIVRFFTWSA